MFSPGPNILSKGLIFPWSLQVGKTECVQELMPIDKPPELDCCPLQCAMKLCERLAAKVKAETWHPELAALSASRLRLAVSFQSRLGTRMRACPRCP